MPSLKGRKKATTEEVKGTNKTIEIQRMRKVNFEKNPSLKAFFSVLLEGYPINTKVAFTEKEEGDNSTYGVVFQRTKNKKDGKSYDCIHPIDSDTRKDIINVLLEAFTKFFEEEENVVVEENNIKVSQIVERNNFSTQLGDAIVETTRKMVLENLELHVSKDGKYYIAFPGINYKDKDGQWQKMPFFWPQKGSDTVDEILEKAVKEYEA